MTSTFFFEMDTMFTFDPLEVLFVRTAEEEQDPTPPSYDTPLSDTYALTTPPVSPSESLIQMPDVTTTFTNDTEQQCAHETGAKRTKRTNHKSTPYKGVERSKISEPQQRTSGLQTQNVEPRNKREQGSTSCETPSYPKGAASPDMKAIRGVGRGKLIEAIYLNCNPTTAWGKKKGTVLVEWKDPFIHLPFLYPQGLHWVPLEKN